MSFYEPPINTSETTMDPENLTLKLSGSEKDVEDEKAIPEKEAMIKSKAVTPDLLQPVAKLTKSESSSSTIWSDESMTRGTWGKKLEFMLTCISYAVGLGNFWRFPYLCYKNGGGAFLIPYFTMLAVCGLPIFFMELAFGQFASLGPIAIWKICPIFKGIGHSMVLISLYICIYFAVIIAYVVFYIFASFSKELPWESCNNEWNSAYCTIRSLSSSAQASTEITNNSLSSNLTTEGLTALANSTKEIARKAVTPSEEYFYHHVLAWSGGIEDIGAINWPLMGALALVWLLAGLALIRGIQSLGKVSYITATFPYFCVTALLITAIQLDGAKEGLMFYLTPNFSRLLDIQVWSDAAIQIFYSMGPCMGSLIMMGSFNKFDNNCMRDAVLVSVINCSTSFYGGLAIFAVLGFMAKQAGVEIENVAQSGPGLTFVVYPEGLAQMPGAQFWCILFFVTMFIVGMGTLLGMFEAVLTAIEDEFPICRQRRSFFRMSCCAVTFLLGAPQMTSGGFYIMNLMDQNVGGVNLLLIGFLEMFVIMWVYGYHKFSSDIYMMLGRRPGIYWRICWQFLSILTLLGILVFLFVRYQTPTLGDYHYPYWAVVLGWLMTISSVMAIPVVAVVTFASRFFASASTSEDADIPASSGAADAARRLLRRAGETLKSVCLPDEDWGPASKLQNSKYQDHLQMTGCDLTKDLALVEQPLDP